MEINMRIPIIDIGNSKGIRIPQTGLKQSKLLIMFYLFRQMFSAILKRIK